MIDLEKIYPIVLLYEEAGWKKATEDCLSAAGFRQWDYADRDGVGSMSKAFNRAFYDISPRREKYIWFVTNVTFPPEMPAALLDVMEKHPKCAAVHPVFDSDHPHIKTPPPGPVPFIEWTAPMIRIEALDDVGLLDEALPYVHFDLDWSYRAREAGWELRVDGTHRLQHTYLWKDAPEQISRMRRELRTLRHPASVARMIEKYGPNWKNITCPTGTCG